MAPIVSVLLFLLSVVQFIVIVHIIVSWLINFDVLNVRQPLVRQIWQGLNQLLEPIYAPIRRALPATGGLDLAPLVVLVGIVVLRILIAGYLI